MRTIVVGGGISGLALAHGLQTKGCEVLLLEGSSRLGGVVRTVEHAGVLTEDGPNSLLDRVPEVGQLLEALALNSERVPASDRARRRYVYSRGRMRSLSPHGVLFSGLLSFSGRLRLLLEPLSGRAVDTDESLATFGRRHLGREATEVLLDAAQSGVFAGDLERLSAPASFPQLAEMERRHRSLVLGVVHGARGKATGPVGRSFTFRAGLETLVRRLGERLGSQVRLGANVSRLSRSGQVWSMELTSGDVLQAEQVALAVPAQTAAALLAPLDSGLASWVAEIRYVPVAVVHLVFPSGSLSPPDGFGFLVPGREKRGLLGTLHISTVFPHCAPGGEVLLTCMLGGARAPELVSREEPALVALARDELRMLTGLNAVPSATRVIRWPRAIPQYEVGHLARLRRIDDALARWPGLFLTGNAYRGPGLADCIRNAAQLSAQMAQTLGQNATKSLG
jgi:oxygen-dependent protoporphyrinogen oxidase